MISSTVASARHERPREAWIGYVPRAPATRTTPLGSVAGWEVLREDAAFEGLRVDCEAAGVGVVEDQEHDE